MVGESRLSLCGAAIERVASDWDDRFAALISASIVLLSNILPPHPSPRRHITVIRPRVERDPRPRRVPMHRVQHRLEQPQARRRVADAGADHDDGVGLAGQLGDGLGLGGGRVGLDLQFIDLIALGPQRGLGLGEARRHLLGGHAGRDGRVAVVDGVDVLSEDQDAGGHGALLLWWGGA